ncbi:MAG TPA: VTT domain-containing protein [Bryobacteraceae bacterium]|nr:VTT domain-containing protein [Bryobacteraceae bacterium]
MVSWIDNLARHGVGLLFATCLVEALGLPVPAAVALLAAGALVALGKMTFGAALLAAVGAFLAGDIIYFYLGRKTGWWLLGMLCRISTNPDSCILTSAEAFYRRGRAVLLICKFIPGLNTMAPPLAGSMNMPVGEFLALDTAGIFLYAGVYLGLGYICRDVLGAMLETMGRAGAVLETLFFAALLAYVGYRLWLAWKSRVYRAVPRAGFTEIDGPIFDVRSHGYYDADARRISGSTRLEPNRLSDVVSGIPQKQPIYLYCTCRNDETSARVAHILRTQGVDARVISGGLAAWTKAGGALEPVPADDLVQLPSFARR